MSTTGAVFYPGGTAHNDWDGTDPTGGDFRKLLDVQPATSTADTSSACVFGTAVGEIVVHPYVSNSTLIGSDTASKWGWAVNTAGTDGMGGTATAQRFTPAGVWTFLATLGGTLTTSTYSVTARVYRTTSDGTTRTLLFTATSAATVIAATGTAFTFTSTSQPKYNFSLNEDLVVSYSVSKTSTSVGAETALFITAVTGVGVLDCSVTVPSPGMRTEFLETVTVTGVGTSALTVNAETVTGVIYDSTSVPMSGATAKLFRQSDDTKISELVTGADGRYTFTRGGDTTTTWYVVGFSDGTHHGTTDRSLTAS